MKRSLNLYASCTIARMMVEDRRKFAPKTVKASKGKGSYSRRQKHSKRFMEGGY